MIHVFETSRKLNIVDSENNFVGFYNDQQCCENFFAEVHDLDNGLSKSLKHGDTIDGTLDVKHIREEETPGHKYGADNILIIPIIGETDDTHQEIRLENHHNGYYYHIATIGVVEVKKTFHL